MAAIDATILAAFGETPTIGERSNDQYLALQPLELGDTFYSVTEGMSSPGIPCGQDDLTARQVVIPLGPTGYASNWRPRNPPRALSYASGNCTSEPDIEETESEASSTMSQIDNDYRHLHPEDKRYIKILKARIANMKQRKRNRDLAWTRYAWKLEDRAIDARVETWANEVAVFHEMKRMKVEKFAKEALLQAEVLRLGKENEARK